MKNFNSTWNFDQVHLYPEEGFSPQAYVETANNLQNDPPYYKTFLARDNEKAAYTLQPDFASLN